MRAFLCLTLVFMSLGLMAETVAQATVTGSALYLDNLIIENLSKLQLIAATPEASQGDWPGIKRYLAMIPNRLPGVWFYVLPDGNYYSLDKDFTNLNLRDRAYFKDLFEGKPVLGYPVFSRSSGKKSAVVAAPIWKDGKVSGALGVSVYLDELHHRLNADLGLGDGYTWFAVNSEGLTMLDTEADFIFMNALTQSPASLKDAIVAALQKDAGQISYELGELKREGRFQKLPNLDWWLIVAHKGADEKDAVPASWLDLQSLKASMQSRLEQLAAIASGHLKSADDTWGSEASIREVLRAIIEASPLIVDVAWVDDLSTMRYIEPPECRNAEGVEIIKQAHVRVTLVEGKAVFSQTFISHEGFPAVVLAFPVKNSRGEILGAISMLLRPELLIADILNRLRMPPEAEVWVMDTAGRMLYDNDPKEVGLLLFEDPLYQEYESLLKLGRQIIAEPSGKGEYVFEARGGTAKTVKAATWDTVGLFGTEWRVVLARKQR